MPYEKKTREWLDWNGELVRSESWWEWRPQNAEERKAQRKKWAAETKARKLHAYYGYLDGVMHYQINDLVHLCECGVYTQMGSRCSKCSHVISREWDDPTIEHITDVQRMNSLKSLFLSGKMETDRFFELHDEPSNWKRFDRDSDR